jgi:hypothetical protein
MVNPPSWAHYGYSAQSLRLMFARPPVARRAPTAARRLRTARKNCQSSEACCGVMLPCAKYLLTGSVRRWRVRSTKRRAVRRTITLRQNAYLPNRQAVQSSQDCGITYLLRLVLGGSTYYCVLGVRASRPQDERVAGDDVAEKYIYDASRNV